jgi:hypothetical protein
MRFGISAPRAQGTTHSRARDHAPDAVELGHREMFDLAGLLVATGRLDGVAGAGAIDEDPLLADGRARPIETGIDFGIRRDAGLRRRR